MSLTIKELENKREIVLLLDGEFWKKVRKSLFLKGLKELPDSLSISELEEAFVELEKKAALRVAADLLSRRSLLEGEIKNKLKERLLSESSADHAISRLQSMGYLNEQDGVVRAIHSYFNRGFGPKGIFAKLQRKTSISAAELKEKIFSEIPEDKQLEKIEELAERKRLDLSEMKNREKLYRFLASRGFSSHLIGIFLKSS